MKNTFRLIGIIALFAVIGFSFPSCGDTDSGGNVSNDKAVYTSVDSEGNVYELTITKNSDKAAYAPKAGDLFKLVITLVNGTMKTSEGTVTGQVKSGNTTTITLTVSDSASFSVSVSAGKDEASSITEINGSIPITESSDGDTSSVDASDSPLAPYVPVSLTPTEIASYLANKPVNTASSAYFIKLKVTRSDELSIIKTALWGERDPNKYVKLDLAGSTITSIGMEAFEGCFGLTSVTIPDSVTRIGRNAFHGCHNLTNITIPNSVATIGERAFFDCPSLASVTIGNSVTSIGERTFSSCRSLTSVIIPDSVTSIGSYAFDDCRNLTRVTIGNGVTSIGDWAFYDCTSLASITIPDNVTSIGDMAFWWCDSLASVTIGNGVTSIGRNAFASCESLASVIIGNGVTSIGAVAFANCDSITNVTFKGTIPSSGFSTEYAFPGNLRSVFYATDKANGTPGTYTRSGSAWTLQ